MYYFDRNEPKCVIFSGKSVDELTDFCKNLSRQEALGELSSVSEDSDNSEVNEAERPFHHPFLVKDKAPIVLNIKVSLTCLLHSSKLSNEICSVVYVK